MKRTIINTVAITGAFCVLRLILGDPIPTDAAVMFATIAIVTAIESKGDKQ